LYAGGGTIHFVRRQFDHTWGQIDAYFVFKERDAPLNISFALPVVFPPWGNIALAPYILFSETPLAA